MIDNDLMLNLALERGFAAYDFVKDRIIDGAYLPDKPVGLVDEIAIGKTPRAVIKRTIRDNIRDNHDLLMSGKLHCLDYGNSILTVGVGEYLPEAELELTHAGVSVTRTESEPKLREAHTVGEGRMERLRLGIDSDDGSERQLASGFDFEFGD